MVSLENNSTLRSMRREARRLQAAMAARQPGAVTLVATHAPGMDAGPPFPLHLAQLVVARVHGFTSWPALKRYFELAEGLRFDGGKAPADESSADRFCRLATLDYADDGPARWAQARALLAAEPDLPRVHIWAAASAADGQAVLDHLENDPSLVTRRGGPHGWSPLYYLTYSRLHGDPAEDVVAIARELLERGADPHEGYLWGGQPLAFTLLTGAFGEGELGPERQPRHAHAAALARLFLTAGADPNDGQALYNRMFSEADDHLELLFEFGLGRGDGGPWRARLGDLMDSPAELLRGQLSWAIDHGFVRRVQLLASHGVDLRTPLANGLQPLAAAIVAGRPEMADVLRTAGATEPELDSADRLIGCALAGDRPGVDAILEASPEVLVEAKGRRPGLMVWATSIGSAAGCRLLADLGFDVNAMGRGDTPVEQPWQTALHQAAGDGDLDLVRLLLSLGADPALTDRRFDSTPEQWAEHFGHDVVSNVIRTY